MKTLETNRLILRNFSESDKNDLFALLGDEQTCLDDGGYHAYSSMEESGFSEDVKYLAQSDEHYAVTLRETGRTIGLVHIMKAERAVKTAELGYAFNKDFRRRGYAKEAVRAVIDELFSGDVKMIVCTCYEYNTASAKVLESLGFAREGRIENSCDHPQFGLIDSLCYTLEKK